MPCALEGKTILITGAAGGIGSATARVCAEQGASLVLADRDAPEPLAAELRARNVPARAVAFDVTDRAATEAAIAGIDRLDALVANAGYCPWDDWNAEGWDQVFHQVIDINLLGVMHLTRAALAKMAGQGCGRMVLVSSVAARMGGLAASPHYVAAKGGTHAFVKWLARKAAESGVNVNSVAPGATDTGMTHGAALDTNKIPLRRMAQPREIALPIAFLCSDGASYLCGATLDVNGGVYMT
ncbi:3-oxoacyl-[acyl-carrier-protein] reductase FabG [Achromobacter spanius]|jgi:NAD(P)-dependent dehydrogenase (short-subunit alcohol dehydrogenase family)|uniref:SDR family NAD(P)-dependent oxidoreductase n=1 Tax=Achromobacter spanius TaxID=217203 RepID=UPI000C2BBE1F|nr:SDR family NAD(P)-dependent oxidoreductase [Achromobacter spanius]AUA56143.1 NAD(P)-dependent oxidoreductase [Achromobacter spanius]CAB3697193.1 3-oxoacyl-[acyl-carrier-protein] reductase FabG [Achromobacter spanius]SPT39083.1 3-oxoacyl-[acyl-carrier-protein] reductase FabG [Achromobacter denitrificans]VEE56309.1 3-oxoacyl-[acyl-carrier-protein] reductase FabG [Achromobacter spanius]